MSIHLISKALITEIDIIPNLLSIKDYPKVITNAGSCNENTQFCRIRKSDYLYWSYWNSNHFHQKQKIIFLKEKPWNTKKNATFATTEKLSWQQESSETVISKDRY